MSRTIDWEGSEENVFYLRVVYGLVILGVLAVFGLLKTKIDSTRHNDKVTVHVSAFEGGKKVEKTEVITESEYDKREFLKAFLGIFVPLVAIAFVHYKWMIYTPLVVQIVLSPYRVFKHNLTQIYFFNKDEKRPFKEDNPLTDLMSKFKELKGGEQHLKKNSLKRPTPAMIASKKAQIKKN